MSQPVVGILMGSQSDAGVMAECTRLLSRFGVPWEARVSSAHRTPADTARYASEARARGLKVIVVGAGMAAHLGGAVAAQTTLPVVAVPIDVPPINGLDALLSTVQMPPGIPVGTMAVGKAGARNAALFAVQILATHDADLAARLDAHRQEMVDGVAAQQDALAGLLK